MKKLEENELNEVNGGVNYMNMKLPALQNRFESACKKKNLSKVMEMLPELNARGYYGWARETAAKYGITSI